MTSCRTCKHARFARTPTGRIKTSGRHECAAPLPDLSKTPQAVRITHIRWGIQPDFGTECPAYEQP